MNLVKSPRILFALALGLISCAGPIKQTPPESSAIKCTLPTQGVLFTAPYEANGYNRILIAEGDYAVGVIKPAVCIPTLEFKDSYTYSAFIEADYRALGRQMADNANNGRCPSEPTDLIPMDETGQHGNETYGYLYLCSSPQSRK